MVIVFPRNESTYAEMKNEYLATMIDYAYREK